MKNNLLQPNDKGQTQHEWVQEFDETDALSSQLDQVEYEVACLRKQTEIMCQEIRSFRQVVAQLEYKMECLHQQIEPKFQRINDIRQKIETKQMAFEHLYTPDWRSYDHD